MTVTLNLPPEKEAVYKALAQAQARGLSLEQWMLEVVDQDAQPVSDAHKPGAGRPLQTAADIILDSMRDVPPEIMATMPEDGASQHDHYIYGRPKREV